MLFILAVSLCQRGWQLQSAACGKHMVALLAAMKHNLAFGIMCGILAFALDNLAFGIMCGILAFALACHLAFGIMCGILAFALACLHSVWLQPQHLSSTTGMHWGHSWWSLEPQGCQTSAVPKEGRKSTYTTAAEETHTSNKQLTEIIDPLDGK